MYAPPCVCTAAVRCLEENIGSLRSTHGSLRSTRGPAPTSPLNNKTPAVATDRLVYSALCVHRSSAVPCVCTAAVRCLQEQFASLRWTQGPTPAPLLNNTTPTVATGRLVCLHCLVCAPPTLPTHMAHLGTLRLWWTPTGPRSLDAKPVVSVRGVVGMWGRGIVGRGRYWNEQDSPPTGQLAACPLSRYLRRAGMSAEPMSGLIHQAADTCQPENG